MKLPSYLRLKDTRSLLPVCFAVCAVTVARQLWWLYVSGTRGPTGPFALELCCPYLLLLIVSSFVLIVVVARSIHHERSILPAILLFTGIVLTFQLPLPEPPPTPEKLHFLKYRVDYEAAIELARSDSLKQSCPNSRYGVLPPKSLEHVSAAGCIYMGRNTETGLTVHFNPLENFYHPIVYAENDSVTVPCKNDPFVEEKIDDHWYVCEYDWN